MAIASSVPRRAAAVPPIPSDCIRWNKNLSKAFDIAGEQLPPRSIEEALVSRFLGVEIKHLERRVEQVPSVRMGAFLTAIADVLDAWAVIDVRNIDWRGQEAPPLYDVIQLNSTQSRDFLIDGMRFVRQGDEETGTKATLRVEPRWWGLQVTAYGLKASGTAEALLGAIVAHAGEINFLKGEAFSLSGEFLPKTAETFDDLILDAGNASAIGRVVSLINARGKALENRGVLLMGPPGTGKTLAARIVRNEAKATFIWVSSRDFHYAGSFGGFTAAFDIARECAPSVVVFEDVDNWLTDRTVDLIKTEMDGVARSSGVVTMMTTNYPEQLPAALIDRPGRFHDVLKFDLPTEAARKAMLVRWLPGIADADAAAAAKATAGYSGAHVRELARFASIIGEQESVTVAKALVAALAKLKEQRDLISATQRQGSAYKMLGFATKTAAAGVEMRRAYATFAVKSINEDQRIVTGIASNAETDRQGDVLEPDGAQFSLPLPFLWQHSQLAPIGEVFAARVASDGIHVQARIFDLPDAPPALKARLDEAWASIKSGLVRGLSVGWKPLQAKQLVDTGGIRALKWLWLELSAVTIPANAGASIQSVKSFASTQDDRAALGLRSTAVRLTPGASGRTPQQGIMKTTQEQITAFEATRQAKTARMGELMATAADAGATLDDAQTQEYDALATDVKSVDAHLVRLREMEEMNKRAAAPVVGLTPSDASRSRAGIVTVRDQLPPGIEFTRYAMCLAAAKGNTSQALEIARARFPDQPRIAESLKAAVAAGTTTDPTWAGALVQYQQFAGDFIDFLRPQTIIGKFGANGIPSLRAVPFNIRIPGQTSGGTGYWVGQGQPKPVTAFDFANLLLRWAKVANIAVLTEDLIRFSSPSAEALVRAALANALIARCDTDFVDPFKAEVVDVSPASITYGISGIPSSGTDAAAVRVDVAAIFAPFIAANLTPTDGVWLMSATTALALSLMRNALGQREFPDITMLGGRFEGLPVIVSQYLSNLTSPANNIVVLVNASDIYLADDGQVVIDASREASLEMTSTPSNATSDGASPPAPVASQHMVSLWQTNSVGLRAERYINWKRRRDEAVAYLQDVAWSPAVTP